MANEGRTVSGNVTVDHDSKYRVAFDLAEKIAYSETLDRARPRRYWLELYNQCLQVVSHRPVPDNIQERPEQR